MDTCYNCGRPETEAEPLTDDHIPPKGLFRGEKISNLITVRACRKCNESFSQLDNDMRAWLAAVVNRSEAGERVFKNKVLPKLGDKDKNIHKRLGLVATTSYVNDNGIFREVQVIAVEQEPARRWLIRITKGLMRHFYPEEYCAEDEFRIQVPAQNERSVRIIRDIMAKCQRDGRGNRIFDFWRGKTSDGPVRVWVYVFFGNACCMITHAKEFPPPPRELPPIVL